MLMDEMRCRRRPGEVEGETCEGGCLECPDFKSSEEEAATEATSVIALNVARIRENEGAFVSGGLLSAAAGEGGGT